MLLYISFSGRFIFSLIYKRICFILGKGKTNLSGGDSPTGEMIFTSHPKFLNAATLDKLYVPCTGLFELGNSPVINNIFNKY